MKNLRLNDMITALNVKRYSEIMKELKITSVSLSYERLISGEKIYEINYTKGKHSYLFDDHDSKFIFLSDPYKLKYEDSNENEHEHENITSLSGILCSHEEFLINLSERLFTLNNGVMVIKNGVMHHKTHDKYNKEDPYFIEFDSNKIFKETKPFRYKPLKLAMGNFYVDYYGDKDEPLMMEEAIFEADIVAVSSKSYSETNVDWLFERRGNVFKKEEYDFNFTPEFMLDKAVSFKDGVEDSYLDNFTLHNQLNSNAINVKEKNGHNTLLLLVRFIQSAISSADYGRGSFVENDNFRKLIRHLELYIDHSDLSAKNNDSENILDLLANVDTYQMGGLILKVLEKDAEQGFSNFEIDDLKSIQYYPFDPLKKSIFESYKVNRESFLELEMNDVNPVVDRSPQRRVF